MSTVIQPLIPYDGPIIGGMHEGKKIKIIGKVPYGADRFTVNLMAGTGLCVNDRLLHLSIRFNGNTVVRNTYYQNSWGTEERSGPFPFAMGEKFKIVILVQRAAYQISVNEQHYWEYTHRLPFTKAQTMFIDGDVSIQRIEYVNKITPRVVSPPSNSASFNQGSSSSSLFSSLLLPVLETLLGPEDTQNKVLPCVFPIHGGIKPGMSIYISGRPTSNPHKFTFNIQKGASSHPLPDIAFHFDVRFFNHSIVRNSRLNDVWYSEETMISHFPFHPGCNFDVVIKVESDAYMVMVNGQHFVSFRHRLNSLSDFNVLSIENDVIITSIKYT